MVILTAFDVQFKGKSDGSLHGKALYLSSINFFTFGKIRQHFVLAIVVVSSFLFASASMAEHEHNPV